jgi:hypothetical protein
LNVAAPGVLGNDTDADGNALTAALVLRHCNRGLYRSMMAPHFCVRYWFA